MMSGRSVPVPVYKRAPWARERAIAAKRAEMVAGGSTADAVAAFDAVTVELRAQERVMLAGMAEWATLVVDSWARDHAAELARLPAAVERRLLVEAVVAYLYGFGLVEPVPPVEPSEDSGGHPVEFVEAVPAHLHPDVASVAEAFQALWSGARTGNSSR